MRFSKLLKKPRFVGRACKPDSPGCTVNKQVVWNQRLLTVNDVNLGSVGRFCVTLASHTVASGLCPWLGVKGVLRSGAQNSTPRDA